MNEKLGANTRRTTVPLADGRLICCVQSYKYGPGGQSWDATTTKNSRFVAIDSPYADNYCLTGRCVVDTMNELYLVLCGPRYVYVVQNVAWGWTSSLENGIREI